MLLRLITSALIPSFSSSSAAYRQWVNPFWNPVIVTSLPFLRISALPMGRVKSVLRASSLTSKMLLYKISLSRNTTGF